MRRQRWLGLAVGLLGAAVVPTGAVAAQEFILTLSRSSSDYREYDAPLGVGLDVSVFPQRVVGLRVGVRRHADDGSWLRSTCVGLIPPDSEFCRDDRFDGSYAWISASVGPEVRIAAADRIDVTLAGLVSRIWLDGEWTGEESGLRIGRAPRGSTLGLAAMGGVRWAIDGRWGLNVLGRVESPRFTVCVSDTYYPFCDGSTLRTVEVGVSFRR